MGWIHVDHKMISWHQQTRLFLGAKRAVHVYFHLARYLLTMFYFSVRRNMWVVTYHSWLAFVLGGSAITSRLHARCKRRGCCITKILWRKHFLSWLSAIFQIQSRKVVTKIKPTSGTIPLLATEANSQFSLWKRRHRTKTISSHHTENVN